jgi:hypothetical protein
MAANAGGIARSRELVLIKRASCSFCELLSTKQQHMRTREEINKEVQEALSISSDSKYLITIHQIFILEVLLDIRDLLDKKQQ